MKRTVEKRWKDEPRSGFRWFVVEDGVPYCISTLKRDAEASLVILGHLSTFQVNLDPYNNYYIRIAP